MNTVITRDQLSFFGTRSNRFETLAVLVGSVAVTFGYVAIARSLDTQTTQLEIWSLVFSFACVWLSRTENVFSMPTGIASVILMGIFLLQVDLVGQGWLQFVYYVPVQLYGWWAWCRGGQNRTELQVTTLNKKTWTLALLGFGAAWFFFWWLFQTIYDNPQFLIWDTSIVGASIIAQVLMTRKKVECWVFWTIPVNISAALLYLRADVPAFSFLYLMFLVNALPGWRQWHKSAQINPA